MADISKEIQNFRSARKGKDVRGSMISLAEKINKESTDAKVVAEGYRDSAKAAAVSAAAVCESVTAAADKATQKATASANSATAAKISETNAAASASASKTSETNAKASEVNAKTSETAALESKNAAAGSASTATEKAAAASDSAIAAKTSEDNAAESEAAAAESEKNAEDFSEKSKSYAVGTGNEVREGDATDNSKFYMEEAKRLLVEAQRLLASISEGGLIPAGTIAYEDLPENPNTGYMYNISNDFTTDARFVDGAGIFYKAGANVYWSAEGKWDVLTGVQVTGVRGGAETDYRTGNVTITKENIGLENVPNVSTNDQAPTFTNAEIRENIASGNKMSVIMGKIMRFFGDLKNVAFTGKYSDLTGGPEEMGGATAATAGTSGLVPAPSAGAQEAFLKGDKTWTNLGAAAFCGIANNDTTTVENFAYDARRGKALRDDLNALYSAANAKWGPARNFTVGNKTVSVDGSGNVSWPLADIGAAPASHNHSYLPLSGGKVTGNLSVGTFTIKSNEINSTSGIHLISSSGVYARVKSGQVLYVLEGESNTVFRPVYASSFLVQSSRKTKDNVVPMTDDEARKILDLEVVTFDYKKKYGGEKNCRGLIAEKVKDVIPFAVTEREDEDGNNILGVDYSRLIPYLIKEIQLLNGRVEELEQTYK